MHRARCEEKGLENETVKGGGGGWRLLRHWSRDLSARSLRESGGSGDAAVVRGLARNGGATGWREVVEVGGLPSRLTPDSPPADKPTKLFE